MARMDEFTQQYFDTALWSSNDESDDSGGEPLDKNYGIEDFDPATRDKMIADCADFQERFGTLIDEGGGDYGRAGHDFWLTRNGHGAGFWDGDWPEPQATKLTDASKEYGEFDLYLGDEDEDGERVIYGTPLERIARSVREAHHYPKPPSPSHHFVSPRVADETAAKTIARQSSGSQQRLIQALSDARAVVLRAYPAPSYALAKDERRDLLQVHVRFPDGLIGYYSPGGPPRLWNYMFVAGSSPGDESLPGVSPNQIETVTTKSYGMREASGHRVADFNSLDDLIAHARGEGATHVSIHEKVPEHTRLYFPRSDGKYEEARVWYQNGYWHTQAPSDRSVIDKPPRFASKIEASAGRLVAEASPVRSAHHRPERAQTRRHPRTRQ